MIWFMMYYMIGLLITISVIHDMEEKPFESYANTMATLLTSALWGLAVLYALYETINEGMF